MLKILILAVMMTMACAVDEPARTGERTASQAEGTILTERVSLSARDLTPTQVLEAARQLGWIARDRNPFDSSCWGGAGSRTCCIWTPPRNQCCVDCEAGVCILTCVLSGSL